MGLSRPPLTVDSLFELPDRNLRYEVLEGQLVVSPRPAGKSTLLPLAIGRGPDLLLVELDPAKLVGRRTQAL